MSDQVTKSVEELSVEEWPFLHVVKNKRSRVRWVEKRVSSVKKQEYEVKGGDTICISKLVTSGEDSVEAAAQGYGRGGQGYGREPETRDGGKGFGRAYVIRQRQQHGGPIGHHHVVPDDVTIWTYMVDRAVKKN
ncbi:hypothetical protein HanXRQr2_Chr08g0322341 [Helianthus annuus]|uniref:Uncharacterized protein n=1 Tax=Helianthus annuus TaxID=4232 RepID=A0A9K3ICE0_HELAN|nr:hypothetical protein HanXRQr2_Chr08g0322341 [Helianthus annuus]KAJ0552230.1 hypothetical protein HanHA89_Chr08g0283001 [Helianthus annuus]